METMYSTALYTWFVSEPRESISQPDFYAKWHFKSQLAPLETDFVTDVIWRPNGAIAVRIESYFAWRLWDESIKAITQEMLESLQAQFGGEWWLEQCESEHQQIPIRPQRFTPLLRVYLTHPEVFSRDDLFESLYNRLVALELPSLLTPAGGIAGLEPAENRLFCVFHFRCPEDLPDLLALEFASRLEPLLHGWRLDKLEHHYFWTTREIVFETNASQLTD